MGIAALTASVSFAQSSGRFTAAQLAEVEQRWALAQQIVARLAPEAAQMGLASTWQGPTMSLLLVNDSVKLAAIARAGGGYQQTIARANDRTAASQKLLGDPADDLVFKPFTPCRYMDTRNVGGKISGIRTFDLSNSGTAYGGDGGCDPKTLAGVASEDAIGAIAFNIAFVDTSAGAPGFLTVRPAGSTQLTAMLNWFTATASAQGSNAAVSSLNQTGPDEIEVMSSGPVHVIMDLLGVFISPHATALDCTTVQVNVLNVAPGQVGAPTASCAAGHTVTGGGCHYYNLDGTPATENTVVINKDTQSRDPVAMVLLNGWSCLLTNQDPAKSFNFGSRARCCRTPGR
jgi:hypothetical protein